MAGRGKGFRIFANIIMVLLAVMCLLPFVLLLVSSLTKESTITAKGYSFLIRDLDFSAYRYLFASGDSILRAMEDVAGDRDRNNIKSIYDIVFCISAFKKRFAGKKFTLILCIFYDAFFRRNDSKLYYLVSGI